MAAPRRSRLTVAVLLIVAPPARAAALPPACTPARDGMQVCMTQEVCTCGHAAAGSLTGRRPGWRWQCDILRMCGETVPADGGGTGAAAAGPIFVSPNITPPSGQMPPSAAAPFPPRRP